VRQITQHQVMVYSRTLQRFGSWYLPSDRFNIGLTYINSYNADDTGTGSGRTNFARFDDVFFDLGLEALDVPTSSNSYGVELNSAITLSWEVGYTNTQLLSTIGRAC